MSLILNLFISIVFIFFTFKLFQAFYPLIILWYRVKSDRENYELPDKLNSLDGFGIILGDYDKVNARILNFLNQTNTDEPRELRLSAEDINTLYTDFYTEFFQLSKKEKLNHSLYYYEIHDDVLARVNINLIPSFTPNTIPSFSKYALHFYLKDGVVYESMKQIMIFDQDILDDSEFSEASSYGLIDFILSCNHFCNIDFYPRNENVQLYLDDQKNVKEAIKKLKSVKVKDGQLVLNI
ncbi:MAG: hypothetical protein ACKPCM_08080 [Pseudanabaena sp.]